jgi:hypothetical protein
MPTTKVPTVGEVHERLDVAVALAPSDTGVTVNAWQVRPAGTVSVRATEPTKLNVLVRVIVEEINEPAGPLGDVALIVKSPTWTVAGAEWEAVPGEPAALTLTA